MGNPMSIVLQSTGGGSVTINEPTTASNFTQTLPAGTGTVAVQGASTNIVSGTAVASTSGTSIDFTSIPSWVKRITLMLNGVSTNGTSLIQVQIGGGSIENTSYVSGASQNTTATVNLSSSTTGFVIVMSTAAASIHNGTTILSLQNVSTNSWNSFGNLYRSNDAVMEMSAGVKSISSTLDRVRITTVNGTDTFDAGSINILYE
jgi:hypothetical protein